MFRGNEIRYRFISELFLFIYFCFHVARLPKIYLSSSPIICIGRSKKNDKSLFEVSSHLVPFHYNIVIVIIIHYCDCDNGLFLAVYSNSITILRLIHAFDRKFNFNRTFKIHSLAFWNRNGRTTQHGSGTQIIAQWRTTVADNYRKQKKNTSSKRPRPIAIRVPLSVFFFGVRKRKVIVGSSIVGMLVNIRCSMLIYLWLFETFSLHILFQNCNWTFTVFRNNRTSKTKQIRICHRQKFTQKFRCSRI